MHIRPYHPADEPALIALWHACGLVRAWNDPHNDIRRKLTVQPELFLVGTIGDRLVASVMAGFDGHRGWVNYLAVDPGMRKSGLGRALMGKVEHELRALGCPKLNLQVRSSNAEVLAFYRRLGYAQDEAVSLGKRLILDVPEELPPKPQERKVSKLRLKISMSLDGFVAGLNQSVQNPLGVGGGRLHEWAFQLAAFRRMLGMEGGEVNESTRVVEESLANIGATVMGRNMFGGHPGGWDPAKPWNGWWGNNPPFHHPVFVLTHHSRDLLVLEGGTTFHFVTTGIEAALEQAKRAAGGKDVSLAGGAKAAQQYLAAGLVDEMEINLAPTLLGSGERLFSGIDDDMHGLKLVRTVATPKVTHLKFAQG